MLIIVEKRSEYCFSNTPGRETFANWKTLSQGRWRYVPGLVRPEDLPEHIRDHKVLSHKSEINSVGAAEPQRWRTLAEMEADYVREVLAYTKGNKQAAVRLLDVDRKTIERMIKRHDIKIESNVEIS